MFDVRPQPSQTSCADTRSRFVFQPSVASNVAELAVLRVKGARGVRARLYWERRAGECGSEVEPGANGARSRGQVETPGRQLGPSTIASWTTTLPVGGGGGGGGGE